jgi:hypothetical protein
VAQPLTKKRTGSDPGAADAGPSPESVIERLREAWAFATSPDGLGLSPERFWCFAWNDYTALKAIHEQRASREMRMWAWQRADWANVHFRQRDEKGRCKDAPFIAEDFLGTGNHKQRSAEMVESRRQVALENARLAQIKRDSIIKGGGSTRVENGKVIVMGVPDIFRKLAEKHEAEKAARGKRG